MKIYVKVNSIEREQLHFPQVENDITIGDLMKMISQEIPTPQGMIMKLIFQGDIIKEEKYTTKLSDFLGKEDAVFFASIRPLGEHEQIQNRHIREANLRILMQIRDLIDRLIVNNSEDDTSASSKLLGGRSRKTRKTRKSRRR